MYYSYHECAPVHVQRSTDTPSHPPQTHPHPPARTQPNAPARRVCVRAYPTLCIHVQVCNAFQKWLDGLTQEKRGELGHFADTRPCQENMQAIADFFYSCGMP